MRIKLRDFEPLILAAHNTGSELGDINHLRGLPSRVVDAGYELITKKLVEYFDNSKFDFLLTFTIIVDKDKSHFRWVWRCKLLSSVLFGCAEDVAALR